MFGNQYGSKQPTGGSYSYSTNYSTSTYGQPTSYTQSNYGYQAPSYGSPSYGAGPNLASPNRYSQPTSTTNAYAPTTYGGFQPQNPTPTSYNVNLGNVPQPRQTPQAGAMPYGGMAFGVVPGYNPQANVKPFTPINQPQPQFGGPQSKPAQKQLSPDEINDLSRAGKQLFTNAFSKSSVQSAYQDLLKQLKATGQKYKDLDFPNELRSLTGGLSEYELRAQGNDLNWRSLIWLRPDEIWGKGGFEVFKGDIDPNDISQGSLGDCYFLSTLASLAEFPHRIRKLFEVTEANEQGCYGVKICDGGVWTTVILDDFIPCSAKSRQPIFSRSNEGELWVLLLEKAWSKIYGSYARIESGLTRECLHDLTGAPTKYFLTGDAKKNDEIWEAISEGERMQYVMTCGAGDFFEGADLMGSMGLVGSHAYSLLAAIATKDKYGQAIKLVKLRNPWGKGEWKGDWADNSSTWNDTLKRELGWTDKDDGIFFMTFDDMLKYFSDIQICRVHDDYKYKALKATCDSRHAVYFKVTVRVPGHYYLTINQESKRKHAEKENYQYSEVFLVVGKKVGNGYEYVEGYQRADKEVWTNGELSAGEYIVYAKVAWKDKRPKEFSLSAYGMGEVDIEAVPKTYAPEFIEKVYINKGRTSKKLEDYSFCGVKNCWRAVELTDDGFGFIYYKNESGKTLEEELYFKFLEGLKLKKPYRNNNYKISVPAGQEKIVITKVLPDASRIRQAFTERARFV